MLKARIIPTLLVKRFGLVKGQGFNSWRHIGGALQALNVYNLRQVDELVFLDIAATADGQDPDFALIDDLADECFMPLTVGGGRRAGGSSRAVRPANSGNWGSAPATAQRARWRWPARPRKAPASARCSRAMASISAQDNMRLCSNRNRLRISSRLKPRLRLRVMKRSRSTSSSRYSR